MGRFLGYDYCEPELSAAPEKRGISMQEKTMIRDLTQGSVTRELILFSVPFILSNLLQTIYNIVDMVVIGQFVGAAGLSAVSVGTDLLHLMTMFCAGFATAGQIIISQYVGSGDRESISRTVGSMFTLILSAAVVLSVICCIFADPILRAVNTPAEAWDQAKSYSITCFVGLVFVFGYNIVSAILRGMGDGNRPLLFIAIASIVNLVLDLLFVAVFHLQAFGAALATILAQGISFAVSLVYLYRRREAFGFDFRPSSFRVQKEQALKLCRMGFPLAIQYAAIMISVIFVNAFINSYGVAVSATNGVGNKLRNLANIVMMSISTAAATMCGQNLGAKKFDRVKRIVWVSFAINVGYTMILRTVLLLFPEQIFRLFTSDGDVLAWAARYMPVAVVAFFASAMMMPFNAVINGLGYASLSLIIGLLDSVVARIALALILGGRFGILGYWYGNSLAGFVTVILAMAYFFSGRWKTRKLLVE